MKNLIYATVFILITMNISWARGLPDHTAKITKDVYSYGNPAKGYFSMFVVTKKGVIVIESMNSDHSKGLLKAIRGISKKPVKYLLHSHNHWDHAGGGKVFRDAGATIIAHAEAYEWMKANPHRDMVLPDEGWKGTRKDLTLGGKTIELHYFGMSHGLGMTVFRLPEEKIIYVADIVTPKRVLFTIVPDFNIKEMERTLEEIRKLDFNRAIYSHNNNSTPLMGGTRKDVTEALGFIRDLRAAIHSEFRKGTNPFIIPNVVKVPKYKNWKMYKEWLPMNAWRILLDEWMGPFPWRPKHSYEGRQAR